MALGVHLLRHLESHRKHVFRMKWNLSFKISISFSICQLHRYIIYSDSLSTSIVPFCVTILSYLPTCSFPRILGPSSFQTLSTSKVIFFTGSMSVDRIFSLVLCRSTAMASLLVTREGYRQWAWASSRTWAWWTMTVGQTALSYSTMASECSFLSMCATGIGQFSTWFQPKSNL